MPHGSTSLGDNPKARRRPDSSSAHGSSSSGNMKSTAVVACTDICNRGPPHCALRLRSRSPSRECVFAYFRDYCPHKVLKIGGEFSDGVKLCALGSQNRFRNNSMCRPQALSSILKFLGDGSRMTSATSESEGLVQLQIATNPRHQNVYSRLRSSSEG